MNDIDWELYEQRVREHEEQGLDRSDAQAAVDAEILNKTTQVDRVSRISYN